MDKILRVLKEIKRLATSRHAWRILLLHIPPFSYISRLYLSIRYSDYVWHNILNRKAHQKYDAYEKSINKTQKKAIQSLNNNGIAIFKFTDLFSKKELDELIKLSKKEINEKQDIIKSQDTKNKYYMKRLFGESPEITKENKLLIFPLSEKILMIVNSYLNMFSRLQMVNLVYNTKTNGEEILSQNWHRDPEDKEFVKMFFYLNDVDKNTGPFSYIPKTHNRGIYRKVFGRKPFMGIYPKKGLVDEKFGKIAKICTGKAGTIILCDTSGLHKGGQCKKNDRIILHAIYLTDAAISKKAYSIKDNFNLEKMTKAQRYGLYIK